MFHQPVGVRRRWPPTFRRVLLWLAPLAFLLVFFFYPFFRILAFSLRLDVLNAGSLGLAGQVFGFFLGTSSEEKAVLDEIDRAFDN